MFILLFIIVWTEKKLTKRSLTALRDKIFSNSFQSLELVAMKNFSNTSIIFDFIYETKTEIWEHFVIENFIIIEDA